MGFLSRLFGRKRATTEKEEGLRPVPGAVVQADQDGKVIYNMLDPMMGQFMGRCIGAVKKAGIKAKGTGQFSIILGDDDGPELPLDPFWEQYQQSQDQQVFDTAVELAQRMTTGGPDPTVEQLYPYVIPEEYLDCVGTESPGIIRPLGHGIHVGLVFSLENFVQGVEAEDLQELGLCPEEAHARALVNLAALARERTIEIAMIPEGPAGRPFVLAAGHWAAATAILLPKLRQLVEGPLETSDILASIPHRDAMLLFPRGDRAQRDAFREMIRDKESDGPKPLTFELFALTDNGVEPFEEES